MNDWNQAPPQQQAQPVHVGEIGGAEKVVITLKAGGPSDPWVVFHASSNAEAADLLGAAEATGLLALVAKASESLKSHFLVGQQLGATPVQSPASAETQYYQQQAPQAQSAPQGGYQQPQGQPYQQPPQQAPQQAPQQQASEAPPGPAPQCMHGVKTFKPAGTSNSGKTYGATWNCPLKVANWKDPNGCPTQWVNSR